MRIKLVFFGSSPRSLPALQKLQKLAEIKILSIVTRVDKPVGRKRILTETVPARFAKENNIPVIKLENLSTDSSSKMIRDLKPDILLVFDYGLMIPQKIINVAPLGGLNVHFSLLPKLRGAAPLPWAILNGDASTGITILKLAEKLDCGDIVYQKVVPISSHDSTQTLSLEFSIMSADILAQVLPKYCKGQLKLTKQNDSQATFAPKLKKDDGKVLPSYSAIRVDRMVRALNPWPGVYTIVNHHSKKIRMKILKSHLANGKIVMDLIQFEGKKPQAFTLSSQPGLLHSQ